MDKNEQTAVSLSSSFLKDVVVVVKGALLHEQVTRKFFKDYKLHSPYGLVQFLLAFEKSTRADLSQIALEIV